MPGREGPGMVIGIIGDDNPGLVDTGCLSNENLKTAQRAFFRVQQRENIISCL